MNGFESFDIRAWVVDDLFTRHIKVPHPEGKSAQRPHSKLRTQLILPIAGAVAALCLTATQAAAQTHVRTESFSVSQTSASSDPDLILGDPKVYWSKVIRDIKNRPRAVESSLPDPDPLF